VDKYYRTKKVTADIQCVVVVAMLYIWTGGDTAVEVK